jgi:hypothetical protein
MPVELRKRKEAPPAPVREAKKKAPAKAKKADSEKTVVEKVQETVAETVEIVKEAVTGKTNGEASKPTAATGGVPKTGDTIDLTSFGGEIETHDGTKATLAKLVEESKGGVVLFTYPKASTPGCKQSPINHSNHDVPLTQYNCRHQASLPLPRLLRAPHRDRLQHLRPLQRQPQSEHHLQDEAEPTLPTAVRPCADSYLRYWSEEGTQGNNTRCICR